MPDSPAVESAPIAPITPAPTPRRWQRFLALDDFEPCCPRCTCLACIPPQAE